MSSRQMSPTLLPVLSLPKGGHFFTPPFSCVQILSMGLTTSSLFPPLLFFFFFSFLLLFKSTVVRFVCNPRTWEAEAEDEKLEANLG